LDSKVDKIYDILLGQTKPTKVVKTKDWLLYIIYNIYYI
jgi:hypothetical protein